MKISNLPNKEFKEMVIRMLNKLKSRIEELRDHFNKETENVIKNQSVMKSIITEMKNALEKIESRLVKTEEWNSNLKDRIQKITQSEQESEKEKNKKMKIV